MIADFNTLIPPDRGAAVAIEVAPRDLIFFKVILNSSRRAKALCEPHLNRNAIV
jgi:hypothetical protein